VLAQEQFGSGGLAEVKIQYNFMYETLWVLNNERHCRGWHRDLVRHFWLWIMTIGSKLNSYGYESNSGMPPTCLNTTVILRELIVSTLLSYTSMSMTLLVIKFHVLQCWNLDVWNL
jgi:hypothetical protein